jgi:hypothetical protein
MWPLGKMCHGPRFFDGMRAYRVSHDVLLSENAIDLFNMAMPSP